MTPSLWGDLYDSDSVKQQNACSKSILMITITKNKGCEEGNGEAGEGWTCAGGKWVTRINRRHTFLITAKMMSCSESIIASFYGPVVMGVSRKWCRTWISHFVNISKNLLKMDFLSLKHRHVVFKSSENLEVYYHWKMSTDLKCFQHTVSAPSFLFNLVFFYTVRNVTWFVYLYIRIHRLRVLFIGS